MSNEIPFQIPFQFIRCLCSCIFVTFRNRDDLPIEKSERYRIAQNKNAIQLALDHVQREDAGHYTLFAKTKTGKISRKDIEVVVEDRSSGDDPPTFVRRLTDLSVKVGTRTRLLVEIRSSSQVKVCRNDLLPLNIGCSKFVLFLRKCSERLSF